MRVLRPIDIRSFKIERNDTGTLHAYYVFVYHSDLAETAKEDRSALVAVVQSGSK